MPSGFFKLTVIDRLFRLIARKYADSGGRWLDESGASFERGAEGGFHVPRCDRVIKSCRKTLQGTRTCIVALCYFLDLDYIGPQVGQKHRCSGASEYTCQIQDLEALEWWRNTGPIRMCLLRWWVRGSLVIFQRCCPPTCTENRPSRYCSKLCYASKRWHGFSCSRNRGNNGVRDRRGFRVLKMPAVTLNLGWLFWLRPQNDDYSCFVPRAPHHNTFTACLVSFRAQKGEASLNIPTP
jgi:hypothetical protein